MKAPVELLQGLIKGQSCRLRIVQYRQQTSAVFINLETGRFKPNVVLDPNSGLFWTINCVLYVDTI